MAKPNLRWFLSALFGVGAVAFGFWLGVSVLNWYSDREYKTDQGSMARPVSILSGNEGRSKTIDESKKEMVPLFDSIEAGEGIISLDSLDLANQAKTDSLSLDIGSNVADLDAGTPLPGQFLEEYHFIKRDKDQIVAALSFTLPNNTPRNSQSTMQLDSLLGKRDLDNLKEDVIAVELWRSPLNFRGYKFSNNVLVVYDMTHPEALKLYQSNGNLYLSYFDVFYQINPSIQFRPLIPTRAPL